MKKIKLISCVLFSIIMMTGCTNDFEEINTDPNNPVEIPGHLLLGTTQRVYMNVLHGVLGGAGGDMGTIWAQLWTKVQYNDEERYDPRRGVMDNIWSATYSGVISEAGAMQDLAEASGNTNLQAVGMIMEASAFQFLTELYGPIPFTEANTPGILKPVYDDEATVYAGVIDMYTQAANLLANGTGDIVASSDLFYGGDTSKWLKLANSLKFRALMRISSTRDVSSELQALINGGMMMQSNADNASVPYLASQPDAHPYYETIAFGSRLEYKVNSTLTDKLETLDDPRLEVYAAENADGDIVGKPGGYGDQTSLPNEELGYTYSNISGIGEFYLNPELPGILMSYDQLSFFKAEAAARGLISGGIEKAQQYYFEGITANFAFNGLSASEYIGREGAGFTTQSAALQKIGEQMWIALFAQGFEAWTEVRRTNSMNLSAVIEGDINEIPSRYYYPTTETSLNNDNYQAAVQLLGGDELTSSLIWQ
jgi:hypothetical protein